MKHSNPTADVGVIVGRFQVAALHQGHHDLINEVLGRHRKVIVILGVAPTANSMNNPLDFEARKQMLMSAYPQLTVLYVKDVGNDLLWSQNVDRVIGDVLTPNQTALLYGSRDSFISGYLGRFDTYELPAAHLYSGTNAREDIGKGAVDSPDFRAGVIWASRNRWPISYQTVDIALFNREWTKLLLAHKPGEDGWRLPGGFADPRSDSLEADAKRELLEETGLAGEDLVYVRSFRVDDWRYRHEPDCIKTALFVGRIFDRDKEALANDDIDRVLWADIEDLDPTAQTIVIVPDHRDLVRAALMRASTIRREKQ